MKKIKDLCLVVGAVLIVGAIGSEQIGAIGFGQAVKQCLIGMPMFAFGVM